VRSAGSFQIRAEEARAAQKTNERAAVRIKSYDSDYPSGDSKDVAPEVEVLGRSTKSKTTPSSSVTEEPEFSAAKK
jgi:hypothetical protein